MGNTHEGGRNYILKLEFEKAIKKRQDSIINKVISEYRSNGLTPERSFAIIASIAELRSTVYEIGK